MPIYEYRCSSCGHELEALQKLSEAPLVTCPACSQNALVKLLSAAGFHLKGSGWYATDFKSSGKAPAKAADAKAGDAKSGDAKSGDAKSGDAKSGDAKSGDAKSGDAKSGDAKSGDAKSGDAKSGDAKSGDARSDTKSEAVAAPSYGTKCACH